MHHQPLKFFNRFFFILYKPGTFAQVKISKTISESLGYPYGECVHADKVNTELAIEMQRLGFEYSRENCLVLCEQKQIIDVHRCYDLRLPQIFNAKPCNYAWYTKISL